MIETRDSVPSEKDSTNETTVPAITQAIGSIQEGPERVKATRLSFQYLLATGRTFDSLQLLEALNTSIILPLQEGVRVKILNSILEKSADQLKENPPTAWKTVFSVEEDIENKTYRYLTEQEYKALDTQEFEKLKVVALSWLIEGFCNPQVSEDELRVYANYDLRKLIRHAEEGHYLDKVSNSLPRNTRKTSIDIGYLPITFDDQNYYFESTVDTTDSNYVSSIKVYKGSSNGEKGEKIVVKFSRPGIITEGFGKGLSIANLFIKEYKHFKALADKNYPWFPKPIGIIDEGINEGDFGIAVSFCPGRKLSDLLKDSKFTESLRTDTLLELINAFEALFDTDIVNHDWKKNDVIIDTTSSPPSVYYVDLNGAEAIKEIQGYTTTDGLRITAEEAKARSLKISLMGFLHGIAKDIVPSEMQKAIETQISNISESKLRFSEVSDVESARQQIRGYLKELRRMFPELPWEQLSSEGKIQKAISSPFDAKKNPFEGLEPKEIDNKLCDALALGCLVPDEIEKLKESLTTKDRLPMRVLITNAINTIKDSSAKIQAIRMHAYAHLAKGETDIFGLLKAVQAGQLPVQEFGEERKNMVMTIVDKVLETSWYGAWPIVKDIIEEKLSSNKAAFAEEDYKDIDAWLEKSTTSVFRKEALGRLKTIGDVRQEQNKSYHIRCLQDEIDFMAETNYFERIWNGLDEDLQQAIGKICKPPEGYQDHSTAPVATGQEETEVDTGERDQEPLLRNSRERALLEQNDLAPQGFFQKFQKLFRR